MFLFDPNPVLAQMLSDNEVEISNTHKESCQGSGQQTWPHLYSTPEKVGRHVAEQEGGEHRHDKLHQHHNDRV